MADIEIKHGYEVLPDNNVRFGVRVINNSDSAVSDVEVILDYTESLFEIEGDKIQKLGTIPPTVPRTAKFILKPLGCIHKEEIGATVRSVMMTRSSANLHGTMVIQEAKPMKSVRKSLIRGVCTICTAMSGNGCRIYISR